MGIQINGNNDIISALDGSWTAEGASINTSGILTATTFEGNVTGTACTFVDGNFSGNVTIGGTLTYEDVTNIDAVGLVTARSGVDINADNKYLKVGAGGDLQFVHTGGETFIANSTGHLTHRSDVHKWENYAGNKEYIRILSDGKVGINSLSPTYGMHLHGTGASNNAYYYAEQSSAGASAGFRLKTTGSHFSIYGAVSGSSLGIYDYNAGAERFTIDSTGEVGIGTFAPAYELHVWPSGATSSGQICAQSNGNNTFAELVLKTDGGTGSIWRNSSARTNYGGANSLNIYQSAAAPIVFFTDGNNERLRIDSSGTLILTNSTNPTFQIKTGSTSRLKIIGDTGAGKVLISSQEGYPLALGAASGGGASEALRIKSDGNIGVGTDNPTRKLHVFGDGDTKSIVAAVAGDALFDLSNTGSGNWSGINFTRERSTGSVVGGSIWMPSVTTNNSALLYLQTQTASAQAGVDSALVANNGVRVKLASQPGGQGADSAFSVEVGASERFRVGADGKIGIGTDNPQGSLHVLGGQDGFRLERDAANPGYYDIAISSGTPVGANNHGSAYFTLSNTAGDYVWKSASNERMRLLGDSGNLGIGNDSPVFKLDVNGTGRFADDLTITSGKKIKTTSSQGQLTIQPGPTYPGGSIKFAGGQSGATDRGTLIFYAGETTSLQERLRISSDGRVTTPVSGGRGGVGLVGAFMARPTSTYATNNGLLKISLGTEEFDANGWFDTSNSRYTPLCKGWYQFNFFIQYQTNINGQQIELYVYPYKNGASSNGGPVHGWDDNYGNYAFITFSTMIYCDGVDDYIEFYANCSRSTNVSVNSRMSGFLVHPLA